MSVLLLDWIEMLVRWLHVVAGIAWIGSSFYFIALDASLKKRPGLPDGVGGEAWQVHGGGFYRTQKYLVAPAELPSELTWFKWEAYTTWLSGFGLMAVVYYLGAEVFLIDPGVLDLPVWLAVVISAGSLALGWIGYDLLCKSRLGEDTGKLALALFVALVASAFLYAQIFSGRAAYLHAGALIGTMMVGNVLFVIIPNQKVVVADLIAGRTPDPALGLQAKQRSLHNNYLTLPVVFTMISNHYPMTFGGPWSWLIFAGVLVVGGLVRHWFNLGHAGEPRPVWLWPAAAAGMALVIALSLPRPSAPSGEAMAAVGMAEVAPIIHERCAACHSANPTMDGFAEPPMGLVLDRPDDIARNAARIHAQTVQSRAMPPGNLTGLTDDERAVLARWIDAGAPSE